MLLSLVMVSGCPCAFAADDDAVAYVAFSQDFASQCVSRSGVQILVGNSHPERTVTVWLDRYHMGVGTGDRSKTEMKPGSPPVALGCSRTMDGPQEWRVVRAKFTD